MTLREVSLPVLQISPVSTIPPMPHTHSFTYYPHYIMFLSQHFSFPLSVPFHQCSIPIVIYYRHYTCITASCYQTVRYTCQRFNIQKLNFPPQCDYVLRAALTTCRQHFTEGKCIMRSFTICRPHQCYLGDPVKGEETG